MRLRLASTVKVAEHAHLFLYHGVKNPEDVQSILDNGFDLTRLNSKWINGYGVATFTKAEAVKKFYRNPEIPILKITFEGNMVAPWDAEAAVAPLAPKRNQTPWGPQDYNLALIAAGIDAVFLNTAQKGILEVVIHNLDCIHQVELA
jgi:hypothetical protein